MKPARTFPPRPLDLICLGRVAVDLYAEQIGTPLERVRTFIKYLGGSAGNIAVGSARLGVKSSMFTRVGDEAMGRFLRMSLEAEGVDTSHLRTDPEHLTALVILGIEPPEHFPLIFYRENCADMQFRCADLDEPYVSSAKALLLNGTTLSTARTRAEVQQIIARAKKCGTALIFDIDYRPVLWRMTGHGLGEVRYVKAADVTREMQKVLPAFDLIVGTEEEFMIAGGSENVRAALRAVRRLTTATLVLKRGSRGCVIYDKTLDHPLAVDPFKVTVLNVLGAGDAFMSGFLLPWFHGGSFEECGELANACGALVVARHGCSPAMPSLEEAQYFISMKRRDPEFESDDHLLALHAKMDQRLITPGSACLSCAKAFA